MGCPCAIHRPYVGIYLQNTAVPRGITPLNPMEPLTMPANSLAPVLSTRPSLSIDLARDPAEVREAQRLRFEIFSQEMGASFTDDGIDEDRFDAHCDHLMVRDSFDGRLVGTTRLLRHEAILETGGFYTETEFDLRTVLRLPGRFVEVGRTCIHPDYRGGGAIATLWSGIAPYFSELGYDYLVGCASIGLSAGVAPARALVEQLLAKQPSAEDCRATPKLPLPALVGSQGATPCATPPLLKAYLRLGAKVCSEAAWDPDFKTADVVILLGRRWVNDRYARRFLRAA